jgi:hypothetical protein
MKRKYLPKLLLASAVLFACLLPACQPTLECGSWAFNGDVTGSGAYQSSFPLSSAFTFNPSNCGSNCNITTDCIIQMVAIYNSDDRDYLYPNSGQQQRATDNGWSIDQLDGWAYGYYGLNNDGKTFDNSYNPTGSNGNPTTLYDDPSGWPNNSYFYALDAAVSFDTKTCNNRILGYYFWSWTIDNNGTPSKYIIANAWKDLDTEFQSAVSGWNAWAPSQGPQNEQVAGQPIDPHCYPFPTLTDL